MSAKKAAAALVEFDCEIAEAIRNSGNEFGRTSSIDAEKFAREHLLGTWTLAMVAAAVGASEEQVVAAVLYYQMQVGSTCVCAGVARCAYEGK